MDWRGVSGLILIAYAAVIWTALGYFRGHAWPNLPVFGVATVPDHHPHLRRVAGGRRSAAPLAGGNSCV
jgi:hypothetical protein